MTIFPERASESVSYPPPLTPPVFSHASAATTSSPVTSPPTAGRIHAGITRLPRNQPRSFRSDSEKKSETTEAATPSAA